MPCRSCNQNVCCKLLCFSGGVAHGFEFILFIYFVKYSTEPLPVWKYLTKRSLLVLDDDRVTQKQRFFQDESLSQLGQGGGTAEFFPDWSCLLERWIHTSHRKTKRDSNMGATVWRDKSRTWDVGKWQETEFQREGPLWESANDLRGFSDVICVQEEYLLLLGFWRVCQQAHLVLFPLHPCFKWE